jgi:hypothetical protein
MVGSVSLERVNRLVLTRIGYDGVYGPVDYRLSYRDPVCLRLDSETTIACSVQKTGRMCVAALLGHVSNSVRSA